MIPATPLWVHDAEVYRDYYLMGLRRMDGAETLQFEMYPGHPLDIAGVHAALAEHCIVTFNGNNYDIPILSLALGGADCETLKRASDAIILQGLKPWQVRDTFGGVDLRYLNHIDLIEVAPGRVGLKTYAARMHSRNLQELPIDPAASIDGQGRETLRLYNGHDLDKTIDLFTRLAPELAIRDDLTREYGTDVRSKSDAQIAEAVIRQGLEAILHRRVFRPEFDPRIQWNYVSPRAVTFTSPGLQALKAAVERATFSLDHKGEVTLPASLKGLVVQCGSHTYTMGIGGLHSRENNTAHHADETYFLVDRDVRSYYPELILTLGLFPAHLGPEFLNVYRPIVERRLEAKKDPARAREAATLKIVVNGSFGKFGSPWSILFAPSLLTSVTITGQLYLLMLIERLELAGFEVVSANTDGVVVKGLRTHLTDFHAIIAQWEASTGLVTEETPYVAIYAKDVNNYVAVKDGGKVKLKGLYSPAGLAKNPVNAICRKAVIDYLTQGKPVEVTVYGALDLREFITARSVSGGAEHQGVLLGKGVRWYYGYGNDCITDHVSGNKVARSEGAVPVMDLPPNASVTLSLNHQWYVDEAYSILEDIGATVSNR